MTTSRPRSQRIGLAVTVVGFVAAVAGCASFGPLTAVTVSDVKSVAGTWTGIIYRSGYDPDFVTLTIQEDGSFDIVATQRVGSSRGKGKIILRQGRLDGRRGRWAWRRNAAEKPYGRPLHDRGG